MLEIEGPEYQEKRVKVIRAPFWKPPLVEVKPTNPLYESTKASAQNIDADLLIRTRKGSAMWNRVAAVAGASGVALGE